MKTKSKPRKSLRANEPSLKEQVEAVIFAGTADSTRKSYQRDTRYFWAWAKLRLKKNQRYPVALTVIQQFVVEHINGMPKRVEDKLLEQRLKAKPGPLKIATIKRYLSSLSTLQQERGYDSILAQPQVRLLLRRARRSRAGKERPVQKAAITKDILMKLVSTCDKSPFGIRDKALLLVGFASGGRRRSELTNMLAEDLRSVKDGYIMTLRRSKTDQDGEGFEVPIFGQAAKALRDWLSVSGIKQGRLFRGIRNSGQLNSSMTGRNINRMIQKRIELIGLDPKQFGAHSLRSGFVTEASRQGMSLQDIMLLTGHSDPDVALGYCRAQTLAKHPVKRML